MKKFINKIKRWCNKHHFFHKCDYIVAGYTHNLDVNYDIKSITTVYTCKHCGHIKGETVKL